MPAAIVTGSARGIGKAIAHRFAADGYDVVVNYRSSERAAEETVAAISAETDRTAIAVRADVSDGGAETLVDRALDAFGGVDHVVNNAGIEEACPTSDLATADFDRVMDNNVNSAFAVSRAAAGPLGRSTDPAPSVVNLSSFVALVGFAGEPHYVASKAALLGLTKSLALELAPEVRVNAIAPGHIETDMTDRSKMDEHREQVPLDRYGDPEEVADAAAYLRDASYVTGETLRVDGGVTLG
jgi:NAD(P)-dependent dehydrogenase (short-subunit alcohol dehydrogenase family)